MDEDNPQKSNPSQTSKSASSFLTFVRTAGDGVGGDPPSAVFSGLARQGGTVPISAELTGPQQPIFTSTTPVPSIFLSPSPQSLQFGNVQHLQAPSPFGNTTLQRDKNRLGSPTKKPSYTSSTLSSSFGKSPFTLVKSNTEPKSIFSATKMASKEDETARSEIPPSKGKEPLPSKLSSAVTMSNPFAKFSRKDTFPPSAFSFSKTVSSEPKAGFLGRSTPEHHHATSAASLFSKVTNPTTPTLVFGSSVSSTAKKDSSLKPESKQTIPAKPLFTSTPNPFGSSQDKTSVFKGLDQKSKVFKSSATGSVFGSKFKASQNKSETSKSEEDQRIQSRAEIQKHRQELFSRPTGKSGKLYSDQTESSSLKSRSAKIFSEKRPLDLPIKKATERSSKALKSPTVSKSKVQVSPEELRTNRTLIVTNLPKELNVKSLLQKHFAKFGPVESVKCSVKKQHALVTYRDHDSAKVAKSEGKVIDPEHSQIFIFWSGLTSRSSKDASPFRSKNPLDEELDSMRPEMLGGSVQRRSKVQEKTPFATLPKISVKKAPKEPEPPVKKEVERDESLTTLLESTATSNSDRYRILDARDKLMRMKLTKQSDLATATAVKGACPDLCPEKERYCRADQFALSHFEMKAQESTNSVVMDPKAVLKEYSRSSADQEEPLPHELRPVNILNLTMDHLLWNVMDHPYSQGEPTMIGEWFDFIWNRTRAIRKDITQQHLCNLESVSLVEKCARFHIHCGEVLVEEEPNIFDPKINNENLTKCLQTLKHFYPDLEEKGVTCPNEGEFRAYEILLNLNDSNIASQVQQLRREIRESKEVLFASNVFQALNSNNFVRFFRLVQQTTYLNACLLHRYFMQIRMHAMRVILKACRKSNQSENFPLEELKRLLSFESAEEVHQFCGWIQLNIIDDNIQLNRAHLGTPESAPQPSRARLLIEKKRTCLLGEIVNGAPLGVNPYPAYTPHESFTEQGRLKREAYDAQDQARKYGLERLVAPPAGPATQPSIALPTRENLFVTPALPTAPVFSSPFLTPPPSLFAPTLTQVIAPELTEQHSFVTHQPLLVPVPPPKDTLTPEQMNLFGNEISQGVVMETVATMATEVSKEVLFDMSAHDAATKILLEVTGHMIETTSNETIAECVKAKELAEKLEMEHSASNSIVSELVEQIMDDEVGRISRVVHAELHEQWLTEMAGTINDRLLKETIEEMLQNTSESVINAEQKWKETVRKFVEQKQLGRCRKHFLNWRDTCRRRKTFEFVRRTFPCGPPMSDRLGAMKLHNCSPKSMLTIQDENERLERLNTTSLYSKVLGEELKWSPLVVGNIVGRWLLKKNPNPVRNPVWKMALLPLVKEDEKNVNSWLASKFSIKLDESLIQYGIQGKAISVDRIDSLGSICVSSVLLKGDKLEKYLPKLKHSQELKGLSSLLLIMDSSEHTYLKKCGIHLKEVLACFPPKPAVSLGIFYLSANVLPDADKIIDGLGLEDLVFEEQICHYVVKPLSCSDAQNETTIKSTIEQLSESFNNLDNIGSGYLRDFIEDGIRNFVIEPIFLDLARKKQRFGSLHAHPFDALSGLYNKAIEHLANVLSNPELIKLSWPAAECEEYSRQHCVVWNSEERLNKLFEEVIDLKLPPSCFEYRSAFSRSEIWKFVECAIGKPSSVVESRISDALEQSPNGYIPAAQIFLIVVEEILMATGWNYDDAHLVHFLKQDLDCFTQPTIWLKATRDAHIKTVSALDVTDHSLHKKRRSSEHSPMPAAKVRLVQNAEPKTTESKQMSLHLNEAIRMEAEASREFSRKLELLAKEEEYFLEEEPSFTDTSHCLGPQSNQDNSRYLSYLDDDLNESLKKLKNLIASQRNSDKIFQQKLKNMLDNEN